MKILEWYLSVLDTNNFLHSVTVKYSSGVGAVIQGKVGGLVRVHKSTVREHAAVPHRRTRAC